MKHLVNEINRIRVEMDELKEYIENNFVFSVKHISCGLDNKTYVEFIENHEDVDYSTEPKILHFDGTKEAKQYFDITLNEYKIKNWHQ